LPGTRKARLADYIHRCIFQHEEERHRRLKEIEEEGKKFHRGPAMRIENHAYNENRERGYDGARGLSGEGEGQR